MCGIIGSVGASSDLKASFVLQTHLLRETQRRGPHATGHFVVEADTNETFWFKSPIPSKIYTGLAEWKLMGQVSTKAMIGHARYKTHGNEYSNNNNHPHISRSGNIGLVHNGTIHRFGECKDQYTLSGQSDSELLLAMIVRERNIIGGIKKIYEEFGVSGDFACEVIYRNPDNGQTRFFFFRDSGRPGRFIDASKALGQMFLCSTTPIWNDAVRKAEREYPPLAKYRLRDLPVEIIPSFQIWEVDAQTLEVTKHKIEHPKRREKKPTKEEKKKTSTAYERWEKKKRRNATTYVRKPWTSNYGTGTRTEFENQNIASEDWYSKNRGSVNRNPSPIADKVFVHDDDDTGSRHFPHHGIIDRRRRFGGI